MNMTNAEYLAYQMKVERRRQEIEQINCGKNKPLNPRQPTQEIVNLTYAETSDEAKLNKTERAYLAFLLRLDDVWVGVQNLTFKLANDCRFTPDFCAIDQRGKMRCIDVKGFQREDALIKIKVAARLFPFVLFVIVKKNGTGWDHQEVMP